MTTPENLFEERHGFETKLPPNARLYQEVVQADERLFKQFGQHIDASIEELLHFKKFTTPCIVPDFVSGSICESDEISVKTLGDFDFEKYYLQIEGELKKDGSPFVTERDVLAGDKLGITPSAEFVIVVSPEAMPGITNRTLFNDLRLDRLKPSEEFNNGKLETRFAPIYEAIRVAKTEGLFHELSTDDCVELIRIIQQLQPDIPEFEEMWLQFKKYEDM